MDRTQRKKSSICRTLLMAGLLGGLTALLSGCSGGQKVSDVDVDLTKMSSTMVYSEVFAMLYSPEEYMGKTVKMEGVAASYHDSLTDTDYYNCIVEDATACCSQGLEFVLADKEAKYPEDGKEIVVAGTYDSYTENGYTFCCITDAKLL